MSRLNFTALLIGFVLAPQLALAQAAAPSAASPTVSGERVYIDGFRSAQWGMNAAQVKAAIQKDFNIAADKAKGGENLAERTEVLSVTVADLLEGAGPARVSYIFGYSSKKLIQVNILWGTAVDPQASAEKIVAAANQLRQLFLDSGYDPATVASNIKMNDGSILVFEGEDADKHTTILRLASATETAARTGKAPKIIETALSLSYVLDPRNPDIYRLKKGQF
ncbi:MAG TPA: hypothetical protein VHY35_05600 [Stellaceae bacterium]|nr:hypothetical protein [Stellaceae bacterium]